MANLKQLNPLWSKLILCLSSGFGVGYLPRIPGTAGTLIGIPFSLALNRLALSSPTAALLTLAATISCAIWLSTKAAVILKQKDPATVVIDEIVGFMVANFVAAPGVLPTVLAFLLFRLFDIVKVFPLSKLEKLPGGIGIVLDDVMAGLYVFVLMRMLLVGGLL